MSTRDLIARWSFKEQWDFVQIPSFGEFSAYVDAVLSVASGDGVLAPQERDWIAGYFATIGMPEEGIAAVQAATAERAAPHMEENLKKFRATPAGQVSCRGLIYDCIRAAGADGEYNAQEAVRVRSIAHLVGVDEETVGKIEEFYKAERDLKARKLKLFFPEGIAFMEEKK